MIASLDELLQQLWVDFTKINPQAEGIHQLLQARGETVVNDHIAFRTFDDPRVNVDRLSEDFLKWGYTPGESYHFDKKRLDARHYEHPDPRQPKIFISELRTGDFSSELQRLVGRFLDELSDSIEPTGDHPLCLSGRPWKISSQEYELLAEESEYAGWMAAFGFRANHFTVLVNSLTTIHSLQELNELVKGAGYALNDEGGEIKGAPAVLLEQSSTWASQVEVEFSDGRKTIPGCYYEFARRYPKDGGSLFTGFVTQSADKIFQSTDRRPAEGSST